MSSITGVNSDHHTTDAESSARRAELHRALGEPTRIAIIDALALSDLAPSELESRLGIPSNLLAHHLHALEAVGLISRHASQGDRRRRYLALTDGGRAFARPAGSITPRRVVFVCTHNSARSPLAAALWEQTEADVPATSAGTHPAAAVHPLAVEAARHAGLRADHRPQAIADVRRPGDLLVTVCDAAHEESAGDLHWSIPDPARDGSPEAFERTVELLRARTTELAQHTSRPRRQERSTPVG